MLESSRFASDPVAKTSGWQSASLATAAAAKLPDLAGYRQAFLHELISERMCALGISDEAAYGRLLSDPREQRELRALVPVPYTRFFRDRPTWDELAAHLLPELIARSEQRPIRIWSAGCASGQELYSMAMLIAEQLGTEALLRKRVQLIGTDISEKDIAAARMASYPREELADIPKRLRDRYCFVQGDSFRIRGALREHVSFVQHDLLRSRAFSRVDLVLCRNVLLYLNDSARERVLSALHFGMCDRGLLVLGAGETPVHSSPNTLNEPRVEPRFYRRLPSDGTHPWIRHGCTVLADVVHPRRGASGTGVDCLWSHTSLCA